MKTIAFLLLSQVLVFPQSYIDIGITGGYAAFSSNSASVNGFTTSLSIGMGNIYNTVIPRLSIYYAGDINKIFPGTDRSYYPYMTAYALKGVYALNIGQNFYYEQSIGLFAASDHMFSNSSGWGGGFIFSILGGADLMDSSDSGFRLGLGAEYGFTVYNKYINYLGIFFQVQYIFSY